MFESTKRFMKNTRTGAIFPYNAELMRLGRNHIVECNEQGVPVGRPETAVDKLYEQLAEKDKVIANLEIRIATLENALSNAEAKLAEVSTDVEKRRKELEDMNMDELRKIAAGMDVPSANLKKGALIEAILDSDIGFKEDEEEKSAGNKTDEKTGE